MSPSVKIQWLFLLYRETEPPSSVFHRFLQCQSLLSPGSSRLHIFLGRSVFQSGAHYARQRLSKALMLPYLPWKCLPCPSQERELCFFPSCIPLMVSGSSCALLRACEYWGIWQCFPAPGSKCSSWTRPRSLLGWDLHVHLRSFPPTCPFHSFHGTKCRNAGQEGASVQYILARSPVQIIREQNLGEACSLYQLFRHRHTNNFFLKF